MKLQFIVTFIFMAALSMGNTAKADGLCNGGCSPDHPAQTYFHCLVSFTGFMGTMDADGGWVSGAQECVQRGAELVQQCVDKSSTPQMQAFHDDIYTAMIFSSDGERIFWDFHVSQSAAYDGNGNLIVTLNVDRANPSDERGQTANNSSGAPFYTVQIGSFLDENRANAELTNWQQSGYYAFLSEVEIQTSPYYDYQTWFRVNIGSFQTQAQAQGYADELISAGVVPDAVVERISQ